MPRKRSISLSFSDDLRRRLNSLWYDEIKKSLSKDEKISLSQFVEDLLWEMIKLRNRKVEAQKNER